MLSDIEIARNANLKHISEIARELEIPDEYLFPYGHYKAKVDINFFKELENRPDGKLVLVTATTPTPAGEGKTTITVGLTEALVKLGKKAMLCLREPLAWALFWCKGRRSWRRLLSSASHGRDKSSFYRRHTRSGIGSQFACSNAR